MSTWAQWVENVEPMAYGVLGLLPYEFGDFTPAEFEMAMKGFYWKEEKQHKVVAWMIASLVAPHVGRTSRKPRAHDYFQPLLQDPKNPFYVSYVGVK